MSSTPERIEPASLRTLRPEACPSGHGACSPGCARASPSLAVLARLGRSGSLQTAPRHKAQAADPRWLDLLYPLKGEMFLGRWL